MNAKSQNDEKQQLLLKWKKLHSEGIIDNLQPSTTILQIGFDSFAADRIQSYKPKSHVVLESHSELLAEAKSWQKQHANIKIIEDGWKTTLPNLGTFDAIYFHELRPNDDTSIAEFLFPQESTDTSNQVKELLASFEKQISSIKVHYSDQNIEDFYQKIGQFNLGELPLFFQKLRDNKNISADQYDKAVKKYRLNDIQTKKVGIPFKIIDEPSDMIDCLLQCLKSHMNKGSKFAIFLARQKSLYNDGQFFDKIITNTDVDYKEINIPVNLGNQTRDAIIPIVEKCV